MGGTITHKTAFSITKDFQSIADFYIDLHGGDVNELVMPYVYYPGIAEETVSIKQENVPTLPVVNMWCVP